MNLTLVYNYLRQLRANNNREWYHAHKSEFLEAKEEFTQYLSLLIPKLSEIDPLIKGVQVKDCLYKIHRDTRFSHDKTPYKQHFAAYISRGGRKCSLAGYYVHLEVDRSLVACGLWSPEPVKLKKLRHEIVENSDEALELVGALKKEGYTLLEEGKLKRTPVGFEKDTPVDELLKLKHYCADKILPDSVFQMGDPISSVLEELEKCYTFNRFLNYPYTNL